MLCSASRVSSSLISGGGGGAWTSIFKVQSAVPLRPSSTWPVIVYAPGDTSRVWNRTEVPAPSTLPPLALQENVSGSLSGSLATAVISTGSPTVTVLRSAEQLIVGGRFGRGATRTLTEELAVPLRPFSSRGGDRVRAGMPVH